MDGGGDDASDGICAVEETCVTFCSSSIEEAKLCLLGVFLCVFADFFFFCESIDDGRLKSDRNMVTWKRLCLSLGLEIAFRGKTLCGN